MTILLNADVGEGYRDEAIMPYLDCANIACGGHAGDDAIMRQTLTLAKQHHVKAGAHPGYADKANFGRHSLAISPEALKQSLAEQLRTLQYHADDLGVHLHYVKPHGALNHDMLKKEALFNTICEVVAKHDKQLAIMVPTNSNEARQRAIAESFQLAIWWEVFADRAYEPNGLLRSRTYDDALYNTPEQIIAQLNNIQQHGVIYAIDNTALNISHAHSVCIHGDHAPSIQAVQQWTR